MQEIDQSKVAEKQRAEESKPVKKSGRFQPGHKLAKGRPKGSKNKATVIKEAIENKMVNHVEGEAMAVLQKTIDMAKDGDTTCIKILMDRLWPVTKTDKLDKNDRSKIIINVQALDPSDSPANRNVIEVKSEK